MKRRNLPSDKMIAAALGAYAKRLEEFLDRRSEEQLAMIADGFLNRRAEVFIEPIAEAIFAAMMERKSPSSYSICDGIFCDAENLGYPEPFSFNQETE